MEVPLQEKDKKLYSKLYVSCSDIVFAQYCADVLLKKGWHSQPWERRGTIYHQQAAFTSALVTAYARPFTCSKGWPKLPSELVDFGPPANVVVYDTRENALHAQLMKQRNQVYAHSDSISYSIRPWRSEDFMTDIVAAPTLRITAEEAIMFQAMTRKLLASISDRMKLISDKTKLLLDLAERDG